MTTFLKKYKWTILYWAILLFFLLYFAPGQNKYYLEQDIQQFKTVYLIPILAWAFGLLAVGLFVFWLIKTKAARQSATWFLSTALLFAFIIFFFKDIFLGIALFANRQITKEKVIKTYQASFMGGTGNSKNNFILYNPSTKSVLSDKKLINELYHTGLKENDTLVFTMNKGIFGVPFSSHTLGDKYWPLTVKSANDKSGFQFGQTNNYQLKFLISTNNFNQQRFQADGIIIPNLHKALLVGCHFFCDIKIINHLTQ